MAPQTVPDDLSAALRRALYALKDMRAKLEKVEKEKSEPIAVVGLHCRFPGASDPDEYRALLFDSVDAIQEVPADRWQHDLYYDPEPGKPGKISTRFGGFVPGADLFDADFFGISPREASGMDPQQRLLLEVAWNALEHAGQVPGNLLGTETGVFMGCCTSDYSELEADDVAGAAYRATGNAASILAGRLSYVLGLRGPSMVVDTACSSSLVAVHLACQSLRSGECSMALAGGVNRILTPGVYAAFSAAGMLAPDGRCKTFDAAADGFVRGEGCGVVVLKRLADAERDGDRILGLILGSAVKQDGRSTGLTAPNGPAQERVIRRALDLAGVNPADIQYVEAHGTGTALGDPIEVRALAAALCAEREPGKPLRIGSVKTNIGHLEAAAGIAGLIKVVLALSEKTIPPQIHFKEPNRHIEWDGLGVDVVTEALPWREGRRLAGVSSFGFGGTNAHVVLEQAAYPERNGTAGSSGPGLPASALRISAKTPEALRELTARYATYLETASDHWNDICFTSATRRARFEHTLTVTADSSNDAWLKLRGFLEGRSADGCAFEAAITDSAEQPVHSGSASAGRGMASLPLYPFQRKSFWLSGRHDLAAIRRRLSSTAPRLAVDCGLDQYHKLLPELNDLCRDQFIGTLHELGWTGEPGNSVTELAGQLGIAAGQRQLLNGLSVWLGANRDYQPTTTPESRWDDLLLEYPDCEPEIALIRRCCESLAGVLTGRIEPLEALFPGGSLAIAEKFYQESPSARFCNGILREALDVAFGRTQTLLEIGAGTGATTSYLLPLLEQREAKYVFTDLSQLFHGAAKQKFSRYSFVEYEMLDIQQPQGDGIAAPGRLFDFVVASNVLHATRDICVALRNIAALLKPGGWLLLLETTALEPADEPDWMYLTSAGLLPGWWNFGDTELRPVGPLLGQAQWIDVLGECGFPGAIAQSAHPVRQSVFVAQRFSGTVQPSYSAVSREQQSGLSKPELRVNGFPEARNEAAAGSMERYLQTQIASVLGFDSSVALDPRRGLFELGLDSLAAIELRNRLQESSGHPLPASALFENPTIESLARYMESAAHNATAKEHKGKKATISPIRDAGIRNEPIAIIGMDCRFPGGVDSPERFWHLLSEGIDAVTPVPTDRWDADAYYDPLPGTVGKVCTRNAGFIDRVDMFDASFFGVSPREAISMDPQQRILLEVAWTALERAGQPPSWLATQRAGVFIGAGNNDYSRVFGDADQFDLHFLSGNALSGLAGRLSYTLGLHGPSLMVDTACSSSLVAVHLACQSLRSGECGIALAGGVNLMLSPVPAVALSIARMLAPDGRCKTFDASADGFGRAEGCGIVILKPLARALADGDPVQAVIRGSAINQDGHSSGFTVPNGAAQRQLISDALDASGVRPANVQYVEAHGTGTSLGDPIEMDALSGVFREGRAADQPLYIGSVKTNIGHAEAASGIAGLIKVVLSLKKGEIPRHLHLKTLNPEIQLDAIPALIPQTCTPWPASCGERTAGVSAFGATGTNAHVVLQEWPPHAMPESQPERERKRALHILPLSAKTWPALRELVRRYDRYLQTTSDSFEDICFTATVGREHFSHRVAVIAADAKEARARLEASLNGGGNGTELPADTHLGRTALGYIAGDPTDWDQWFADEGSRAAGTRSRVVLPTYPFEQQRYWKDAPDSRTWRDWMYRIDWLPAPGEAARLLTGPDVIATRVRQRIPHYDTLHRLDESRTLIPLLGSICVSYIAETWKSMGFEWLPGRVFTAAGLMDELEIQPRHRQLVDRMIDMLYEDGFVESYEDVPASPGSWVIQRAAGASGMAELLRTLGERYPSYLPVTTVLERCGEQLPQLLRGELDPLQLLFSGVGSTAVDIYERAPVAHALNGMMRDAVATAIERLSPGHKLRILEIGAGTGATTSFLLPLVDQSRCEYRFTDISQAFLLRAQQKFRDYACLRYELFDLERDPVEQGFPAGGFDLVVAVNVVHATRDLRESLAHIKRVVAPQGLVFLLEETEQQRWVDLTFGLTEGWWRFTDTAVRPSYPLIPCGQWLELLTESGFRDVAAIPGEGDPIGGCVILLARVPSAVEPPFTPAGIWMIVADEFGLDSELGQLLEARGDRCIIRRADEWKEWENLGVPEAVDCGIVFLCGVDSSVAETTPAGVIEEIQTSTLGALLAIVRSVAGRPAGVFPPIWMVTRCARVAGNVAHLPDPARAPVWSFCDVVRLEHPEIPCHSIDLGPGDGADALLREMQRRPDYSRIALREGVRYAPLLVRNRPSGPQPRLHLRPDATYLVAGGLSGVGLATAQWMLDRGARHLALVGRRAPSSDSVITTLNEMRRAGAEVAIFQADISRSEDLEGVLRECRRRLPVLRGVVNSAMVLEDSPVIQTDLPRLLRVMAPKLRGSWLLHQLTLEDPLELFILHSAIVSVFGNEGQVAYAAANAFLDFLAHYRRTLGLCGLSVNWGAWGETGAATTAGQAVQKVVFRHGISFMPPRDALLALESAIAGPHAQVAIFAANWEKFAAGLPTHFERSFLNGFASLPASTVEFRHDDALAFRKRLEQSSPEAISEALEMHVREIAASVLGLKNGDLVDSRRPLQELGMDSLMAVEMRNALALTLDRTLPATLLYDYPTVEGLSAHLRGQLPGGNGAESTDPPTRITSALGEIEALTDDEVERLFAEKAMKKHE